MKGTLRYDLYFLELPDSACNNAFLLAVSTNCNVWHTRLGHPSPVKLQILYEELHIPPSLPDLSSHCKICHQAKQNRLPFKSQGQYVPSFFRFDPCRCMGTISHSYQAGHMYFLTVVDDHTRGTWIYLLIAKSNVTIVFLEPYKFI